MNCVIVSRSLTEYLLKGSFHEKSFLKEIRNRNGKLTFWQINKLTATKPWEFRLCIEKHELNTKKYNISEQPTDWKLNLDQSTYSKLHFSIVYSNFKKTKDPYRPKVPLFPSYLGYSC